MSTNGSTVTALSVTPVKAMRLHRVEAVQLDADGARGNRRFFVVDERGRMVNSKMIGEFQTVVASCAGDRLTVRLGDPVDAG